MKNFQQNLLIILALCLCGLCAYQWYNQTLQRNEMEGLGRTISEQAAAIQGYTNSIKTMDRQITELDARVTELKETIKTNDRTILDQKREVNRLSLNNESLTNEVAQYKEGVETMKVKLTEAYDGIKKQNESIKQLVAQRD